MATFRAAGTWVFNANNVATPSALSPVAPAGRVAGDLLVLITESRSNTATVATPTGWNPVTGSPKRSATASGGTVYMFTRKADGSSTDSPTVTWSGLTTGTSGDSCGAGILAYQDAKETVDGTMQVTDNGASTTTATVPAITTSVDNSLVIHFGMKILDTAGTSTITNVTERADASTTSGTGHRINVGDKTQVAAGSSGTSTITWSTTTSARALTVSIAFQTEVPKSFSPPVWETTVATPLGRVGIGGTTKVEFPVPAIGLQKDLAIGPVAWEVTVETSVPTIVAPDDLPVVPGVWEVAVEFPQLGFITGTDLSVVPPVWEATVETPNPTIALGDDLLLSVNAWDVSVETSVPTVGIGDDLAVEVSPWDITAETNAVTFVFGDDLLLAAPVWEITAQTQNPALGLQLNRDFSIPVWEVSTETPISTVALASDFSVSVPVWTVFASSAVRGNYFPSAVEVTVEFLVPTIAMQNSLNVAPPAFDVAFDTVQFWTIIPTDLAPFEVTVEFPPPVFTIGRNFVVPVFEINAETPAPTLVTEDLLSVSANAWEVSAETPIPTVALSDDLAVAPPAWQVSAETNSITLQLGTDLSFAFSAWEISAQTPVPTLALQDNFALSVNAWSVVVETPLPSVVTEDNLAVVAPVFSISVDTPVPTVVRVVNHAVTVPAFDVTAETPLVTFVLQDNLILGVTAWSINVETVVPSISGPVNIGFVDLVYPLYLIVDSVNTFIVLDSIIDKSLLVDPASNTSTIVDGNMQTSLAIRPSSSTGLVIDPDNTDVVLDNNETDMQIDSVDTVMLIEEYKP